MALLITELKISTQSNQAISLTLEKNLAILTLKQVNMLESYSLVHSYVEKVIQNPSIHTALVLIQNHVQENLSFTKQIKTHSREKWEGWLDSINHLFQTIEQSHTTWIAGISGPCFGSSLQMALSCHYRIADLNTVFGFNELNLGLIPTGGACLRLPRLIGIKKALDIILKGEVLSAPSATTCGLIHKAVQPLDLKSHTIKLAQSVEAGKTPRLFNLNQIAQKKLKVWERLLEIPLFRQLFYYKIKKQILSETKGFYPAPLKALALIKKTYLVKSLKSALKEESNTFLTLIVSPTTQNLISLHKNIQTLKQKTTTNNTPATPNKINKVAVIGAGAMGGGITHWLACNHVSVLLKDIHSPSLSNTLKYIYTSLKQQTKKSFIFKKLASKVNWYTPKLLPSKPNQTEIHYPISKLQSMFSKIRPQVDYSGFLGAGLIIETVVEDKEIKKKVITESTQYTHPQSFFASNTSSFKISDLAQAHTDPSRFLGLHFFYPAKKSSLIEVVQTSKTQSHALNTVCEWVWQNGKVPFLVQDSPGFLVQRLFLPLISEAIWCLKEGSSIQHIDHIYTSFGFRLGPFQLMDELGLDILLKLITSFKQAGKPVSLPVEISRIKPGFLGKKNKKGFYIYNEKRKILSVNSQMVQDLGIKTSYKTTPHILERGLYRMINEATLILQEQVVQTPEEIDLALILGLDFPAFRGGLWKYANDISLKTVIATLYQFEHKWGNRFQPCSALLSHRRGGG